MLLDTYGFQTVLARRSIMTLGIHTAGWTWRQALWHREACDLNRYWHLNFHCIRWSILTQRRFRYDGATSECRAANNFSLALLRKYELYLSELKAQQLRAENWRSSSHVSSVDRSGDQPPCFWLMSSEFSLIRGAIRRMAERRHPRRVLMV
ncbi:hypothetical protein VTK73DRAFT_4619 [Phialemonium thermophilum]|uniref:C-type lectin domain-containing protein n=1 Tax=Phialemonium thermophilum TaxID=223376 RepID=A0ABR3WSG4_9PEZI